MSDFTACAEALDDGWTAPPCPLGGIALVIGRESDGVSATMSAAAARAVYLPLQGFAESLNLSVAAALLLQRLLLPSPHGVAGARAPLPPAEVASLRADWYGRLAKTPEQRAIYDAALQSPPKPFTDLRWPDLLRASGARIPPKIQRKEREAAEAATRRAQAQA